MNGHTAADAMLTWPAAAPAFPGYPQVHHQRLAAALRGDRDDQDLSEALIHRDYAGVTTVGWL